jgi:hypothetical protein
LLHLDATFVMVPRVLRLTTHSFEAKIEKSLCPKILRSKLPNLLMSMRAHFVLNTTIFKLFMPWPCTWLDLDPDLTLVNVILNHLWFSRLTSIPLPSLILFACTTHHTLVWTNLHHFHQPLSLSNTCTYTTKVHVALPPLCLQLVVSKNNSTGRTYQPWESLT